jgi:ABC-type antimicrobial peptide transport system permease subunit
VVPDTLDVALDRAATPTVYSVLRNPTGCHQGCNRVHYVMKLSGHSLQLETSVRRIVAEVNRDTYVEAISSMAERLAGSIQERAFSVVLLCLFALSGLAVCVAGTMSVAVFLVRMRLEELAIRLACGAGYKELLTAALGELAVAGGVGVLAGAVGAWWGARLSRFLLFGVQPNDSATLAAALAVTGLCVLLAAILPVRRLVFENVAGLLRSP